MANIGRRRFMAGMAIGGAGLASTAIAQNDKGAARVVKPARRGTPLTAQDLEDALVGSSYLGCGGGGGLAEARALLSKDLADGFRFAKLDTAKLDDDDTVACPYALASLAPISDDMQARLDASGGPVPAPVEAAFKSLADHLNTTFAGVILGEIGPLSMAEGLSIAARLGMPALDADTVGRATPEINQHSVRVSGHPLTPAAAVTAFGDAMILTDLRDPAREETIFRALSVVSRLVGVTDAPISGAVAKSGDTLVRGSLSLAQSIGAAARGAKAAGRDPIGAAMRAGDGYALFEGRVAGFDWSDEDGFLVGTADIAGTGPFAGQRLRLDYKNEHLVATRDGQVVATCPDLITVVGRDTAEGINNPDFTKGQAVAVLGFKCAPIWRTDAGLAVFSPRYFGYDQDYVPIEERLG